MLSRLSPEERLYKDLEFAMQSGMENERLEKQSMELYKEILGWTDVALQQKAAHTLKICWSKLGKWQGKLSSKQKDKVKRIKELLGEEYGCGLTA